MSPAHALTIFAFAAILFLAIALAIGGTIWRVGGRVAAALESDPSQFEGIDR